MVAQLIIEEAAIYAWLKYKELLADLGAQNELTKFAKKQAEDLVLEAQKGVLK